MRKCRSAGDGASLTAVLASLALATLAAGCGSSSTADDTLACPSVVIAPDLGAIAQMRPGGHELKDARTGGQINSAQGRCRRDERGIAVDTTIYFNAVRAGAEPATTTLPYFVAVADGTRTIYAEQSFDLKVEYLPGENYRLYTEKVTAHLPLKNVSAGGNFLVIVGFKLTPDQLAFNRAQRTAQETP